MPAAGPAAAPTGPLSAAGTDASTAAVSTAAIRDTIRYGSFILGLLCYVETQDHPRAWSSRGSPL